MLPKSHLKVIAAHMVYESGFSKTAKIQLIRFIEDASVSQLNIFVTEGRISKDNISEVNPLKYLPPVLLIRGALAAGKAAYNKFFGPAVKACRGKSGDDKKRCIRDFKLKALYAKLAALRKDMGKCNQTNDANKCRNTFLKHMKLVEKQIAKERSRR